MNMEFKRKLPTPQTVKDMYPVTEELARTISIFSSGEVRGGEGREGGGEHIGPYGRRNKTITATALISSAIPFIMKELWLF